MSNQKKKIFLFLMLSIVTIATAMAALSSQRQNTSSSVEEEPTPIREGVMTEKQKKHGKLFKHAGPELRQIAAQKQGDIEVEQEAGYVIMLPESGAKPPALESAVCHADAVVLGTLNNKSSQLTEGGNFIFTDYEMTVEEIIKDNHAAPISNNTITVTRDGGAVQLNGRNFRAKREDFKPTVVGQRYLLFLRFIPDTGAYLAYGNGSFQLDGDKIIALGDAAAKELLNAEQKGAETFLNDVRAVAAKNCGQK